MLVGARADLPAVGEHDVGLQQVVDRQAEGAREVPEAAAEREPADAGRRDDAAGGREAVLAGGAVHLAPGAAAADANGPRLRVDLDVPERGEVDDDAVVDRAEAAAVVAAAADGERRSWSRANAIAARDVVGIAGRAISAGRRSIIAL